MKLWKPGTDNSRAIWKTRAGPVRTYPRNLADDKHVTKGIWVFRGVRGSRQNDRAIIKTAFGIRLPVIGSGHHLVMQYSYDTHAPLEQARMPC